MDQPNGHMVPSAADVSAASDTVVARRRREDVVRAAIDVISTEGLHRLSLAKIEQRTGMARGHLTYYFPTKEDILLAVFDRMLARMIEDGMADARARGAPPPNTGAAWDRLRVEFARAFAPDGGKRGPDDRLHALVHTFIAQVGHRDDYRRKLAEAFAGWRAFLAGDFAAADPAPAVRPAVLASVVMALHAGLNDQLAVDPAAFDRAEMAAACLQLLAPLFGQAFTPAPPPHEVTRE